ncbi:hypothetical protein GCM10011594_14590 [Nakamurella endophytica]|uniref:PE cleavage protein A C-terminal domain-containing protein n=1 Tax=Nakamurella endophytica TaxID=1748367 RepID=A0A917SSS3_9ACTN|nr:hypothetical protein GCM10011594_14590 [Nakamurella endophytica]
MPAITSADVGTAPAEAVVAGSTTGRAIPVRTVRYSTGDVRVVVAVSVGGGAPVDVLLDTGSSGLLVDASAVGPQTHLTGATFSEHFVGSTSSGHVATATVTVDGLTTTSPVPVNVLDAGQAGPYPPGLHGVLGIATADGSGTQAGASAFQLGLPAPYDAGSTLDVAADGAGTWTLGPVQQDTGAVAVPLERAGGSSGGSAGTGWAKDVQLCWTIGSAGRSCGDTDFDTGAPRGIVNSGQPAAAGHGTRVPSGEAVSVSTPDGAALWTFTAGDTPVDNEMSIDALGQTQFNTGLAFFFTHRVAWDYTGGRVLITAKS